MKRIDINKTLLLHNSLLEITHTNIYKTICVIHQDIVMNLSVEIRNYITTDNINEELQRRGLL